MRLIFENKKGEMRFEQLPDIVTGLTRDALDSISEQFKRRGWDLVEVQDAVD